MSLDKCLQKALEEKKISKKKANEALSLFSGTVEDLKKQGMSEIEARNVASQQVAEHLAWEKAENKRRALAQIQKQTEVTNNVKKYIEQEGLGKAGQAGEALFEWDGVAPYSNFIARFNRRRGQLHALIESVLSKFEPKIAGLVRPKAGLQNIVRELFGEITGDAAAKELSDAWAEAAELARKMFVRAGGSMPKKESWRLPQHQDAAIVRKQGKEQWISDHENWLDWDKMRNPRTGQRILESEKKEVLEYVYDTIASKGWARARARQGKGRKAIGNQLDQHRFLEFKDSKAWLEMHEKYGDGSVFDAMIGYIDGMSQDIALIETFGPNAFSTIEAVKALIKKEVSKQPNLVDKIESQLNRIDDYYAVITRANSASENSGIVNTFAAVNNILVSSYLGSASLLAMSTDTFTSSLTKLFNKTPGAFSLRQYLKLMNPLNKADKSFAIRSGLIAENATSQAFAQTRFIGDIMGPRLTRRISDTVLRASLLSPHTQATRWAFGMELFGAYADNAGKGFEELPFKDMLKRHGITADDWDAFRKTTPMMHKGSAFLRPDDVLARTDLSETDRLKLADKFMEVVLEEREFAVPTASLRGKTALTGATRPDTIRGQLLRSFALFKNFPVTIMMLHGRRGLQQSTTQGKAAYFAAFGAGMTMAGGLALQAREISKGRDPIDMSRKEFWAKAALTGGGMGVWGDFLFSGINRFGGGPTETAAGPVVDFLGEGINLTIGNVVEFLSGKDTKLPQEIVQFARRHTPGTNIWYARAVLQRMVWDRLQKEVDPKAYQKFQRIRTKLRNDTGQSEWWRSGQSSPSRAPDLSSAFGG